MRNAGAKLKAEERFYMLLNYAQLAATVTLVAGGAVIIIVLLLNSGLL